MMMDGNLYIEEIIPKIQLTKNRFIGALENYYPDLSTDLTTFPRDPITYMETFGVDTLGSYLKAQRFFAAVKALGLILEGKHIDEIANTFSEHILFKDKTNTLERQVYLDKLFQYFFNIEFRQAIGEFTGKSAMELIGNQNFLGRFKLNFDNDISKFAKRHIFRIAFSEYKSLRDLLGPLFDFFS